MKRVAAFVLAVLFCFALAVPASASYHRKETKAEKQANKSYKKYNKQYKKQQKKQLKAERKQIKQFNKNRSQVSTTGKF